MTAKLTNCARPNALFSGLVGTFLDRPLCNLLWQSQNAHFHDCFAFHVRIRRLDHMLHLLQPLPMLVVPMDHVCLELTDTRHKWIRLIGWPNLAAAGLLSVNLRCSCCKKLSHSKVLPRHEAFQSWLTLSQQQNWTLLHVVPFIHHTYHLSQLVSLPTVYDEWMSLTKMAATINNDDSYTIIAPIIEIIWNKWGHLTLQLYRQPKRSTWSIV